MKTAAMVEVLKKHGYCPTVSRTKDPDIEDDTILIQGNRSSIQVHSLTDTVVDVVTANSDKTFTFHDTDDVQKILEVLAKTKE